MVGLFNISDVSLKKKKIAEIKGNSFSYIMLLLKLTSFFSRSEL